ncbi:MAG: hypothetical protein JST16_02910 [Bdellovibrionales bacterium]|nr:hypothetical protein [Bdellovibrionales bacterium]
MPVTASKDVQIKAYDAASGGSLLWTSSVYNTAVSAGKFTINLDAASGSPSLVDRLGERTTSQAIYFQIEVDSGAANGSMDTPTIVLPRMRARGTAFALTANTADALKGVTATVAEMNYLTGVSANVQTQLNAVNGTAAGVSGKVSKTGDSMSGALDVGANVTSTGTVQAATLKSTGVTASRFALFDASKNLSSSATTVTDTEFGYLSGVTANLGANLGGLTANVQTQINGKQATLAYVPVSKLGDSMSGALQVGASITSSGTIQAATVNVSGLTASRVALTDGSKNLVSAAVTDVELAFLVGVTAGIQSQLQRFLGQTCNAGYYLTGFDATGTKVCTALPSSNTSLSYTQVATGVYMSCGILSDQTVQCWGYNSAGQLGNGTTTNSSIPVFVYKNDGTKFLATKVVMTGIYSTCAIQASDSKVYCWGSNGNGQLGNGTTTASGVAVPVSTLGAVLDITGGGYNFCAVDSTGKVWCWGYNNVGQVGDGTASANWVIARPPVHPPPCRL